MPTQGAAKTIATKRLFALALGVFGVKGGLMKRLEAVWGRFFARNAVPGATTKVALDEGSAHGLHGDLVAK